MLRNLKIKVYRESKYEEMIKQKQEDGKIMKKSSNQEINDLLEE